MNYPIEIFLVNHPSFGNIRYIIDEKRLDDFNTEKSLLTVVKIPRGFDPTEFYKSLCPVNSLFDIQDELYNAVYKILSEIHLLGVVFYTPRNFVSVKYLIQAYALDLLFKIVEREHNCFNIQFRRV